MEYTEPPNPINKPAVEDHHELRANGLLKIRGLNCALTSLQRIDALYRQYREVSDRIGTSLVRELVANSRQRARGMSANSPLGLGKRREKQEIAQWLKVWLEVPDLFYDWLEMRLNSREFQRLFPHFDGRSTHRAGKRSFSI